jgi:hypothetical protein
LAVAIATFGLQASLNWDIPVPHGKRERWQGKAPRHHPRQRQFVRGLELPRRRRAADQAQACLRAQTDPGCAAPDASRSCGAEGLGFNQCKVSALRNTRLEDFSVGRLMTLLNALDQDVEIVISPSRARTRRRGAAG